MTFISGFSSWLEKRQAFLQQKHASQLHRKIIVIAPDMAEESLLMLAKNLDSGLFVSKSKTTLTSILASNSLMKHGFKYLETSKYRSILGTETNNCIFDARDGINLDALVAVSGLVKSSGLLCIILPACPAQLQKLQNNGIAHSDKPIKDSEKQNYYFYALFVKALQKQQIVSIERSDLTNTSDIQNLYLANEFSEPEENNAVKVNLHADEVTPSAYQLHWQQQAIIEQVKNSETNVHVILGKRGRGKSTTLAECCINLIHKYQVYICAPNKSQIATFQAHIDLHIQDNPGSIKDAQAVYTFLAPDQALELFSEKTRLLATGVPSLLLIDEVASIAPSLLQKLLALSNKTILAGTTQGYEGSGQGFVQRVIPFIQQAYSHQIYELKTSFRWLDNDPIEGFFEELLYIRNTHSNIIERFKDASENKIGLVSNQDNIVITSLSKRELLTNEATIESVFSLLREAHYQNSPNDIVRLLDDSAYRLVVARNNDKKNSEIVALAILIEEGGEVLKPIAESIAHGKRRTQGHLTPQSLSLYFLDEQWCSYTNLRINRIAVKAEYRRQNIASSILNYCCSLAKKEKIDYVSTSYGINQNLYNFWLFNKFIPVKVGARVDTSSGTVSMIMMKNISLEDWPIKKEKIEKQLKLEISLFREIHSGVAIGEAMKLLPSYQLPYKPISAYLHHIRQSLEKFANNDVALDKVSSHLWYFINCYPILCNQENSSEVIEDHSRQIRNAFLKFFAKGIHKTEKEEISLQLRVFIGNNLHFIN